MLRRSAGGGGERRRTPGEGGSPARVHAWKGEGGEDGDPRGRGDFVPISVQFALSRSLR